MEIFRQIRKKELKGEELEKKKLHKIQEHVVSKLLKGDHHNQ